MSVMGAVRITCVCYDRSDMDVVNITYVCYECSGCCKYNNCVCCEKSVISDVNIACMSYDRGGVSDVVNIAGVIAGVCYERSGMGVVV